MAIKTKGKQTPSVLEAHIETFSIACSITAIIIGLVALYGWVFGISTLKSVLPGLVEMKANTAICLVLLGAALILLHLKNSRGRVISRYLVIAVGLIAFLTILEFIFSLNFGIDQLLFKELPGGVGTVYPGRMAPVAAIVFVLLSLALLFIDSPKNSNQKQLLIFGGLFMSFVSVIGYYYGSEQLYQVFGQMQIALNSAAGLCLLCLGALFLYPNRGFIETVASDSPGGTMARQTLLAIVIVLPIFGLLSIWGQDYGIYDNPFGVALMVILSLIIFTTVIFLNARSLSAIDKKRLEAEDGLKEANRSLEAKVKKRTAELEWIQTRDEALLSSIGDGVVAVNSQGRVMFMNSAAERLLGRFSSESIGQPFDRVIPVRDGNGRPVLASQRPMGLALGTRVATVTSVNKDAYRYIRSDGTEFPVAITATPVTIDGRVIGAINVFRDITKETEIDTAKSEFVSVASHQLKTPMTIISMYTERMLRESAGAYTAKQKDDIKEIDMANRRMIEIVNALLNVSRIELGGFIISPTTGDITAILDNIIHELEPKLKAKDLKIETDYGQTPKLISIDEALFRMVFSNLISNAIQYSPEGTTIRINIAKAKRGDKNSPEGLSADSLIISVADNGYGIPENQQKNIFTKFFRAENARSQYPDGTGLGLYIVKSILEHSGGAIWFKSKENEGSVFYVAIPQSGMKARDTGKKLSPG